MNLEEYIKKKKEELDSEIPSYKVWNKIQESIGEKQTSKIGSIINYKKVAIAAVSITILAIGFLYKLQNKKTNTPITNSELISQNTTLEFPLIKTDTPKTNTEIVKQSIVERNVKNSTLPEKKETQIPKSFIVQNKLKIDENIKLTPKVSRKTEHKSHQNFFDSTLNILKQKIEATPVKWVSQDYFKSYIMEYKNLEIEEENWKKQKKESLSETDFILNLIQINQRKIQVLGNLYNQMKNINAKKGDTTQINNSQIII